MSASTSTLYHWDRISTVYDQRSRFISWIYTKERKIYSLLKGKILEVGTGTGNNLFYYNSDARVTGTDWSPEMLRIARLKVKNAGLGNIENLCVADIHKLSQYFEPNSFDYVTSTCVFCSVPNPIKGLSEISKVLRPNGKLVQIEHGISNNLIVNLGLKMIDPISYRMQGFHLTRKHKKNLTDAGFEILIQKRIDPVGIFWVLISSPLK